MSEHLASLGLALSILSVGFLVVGPNIPAVIGTPMARARRWIESALGTVFVIASYKLATARV